MTDTIQEHVNATHEKVISLLADYITGGYTDTLARLLVYMDKPKAEETLKKLPEPIQNQVQKAYENLSAKKKSDPDILYAAVRVLKDAEFFSETLCDALTDGLTFDQKTELAKSTEEIFKQDPIIALNAEDYIFPFDIITHLDDRAVQKILREVDQQDLAKALKGSTTDTQDKIFQNMSRRAGNILREDMEFMGPVRQADINEAQEKIIKIMIELEDNGEIVICRCNEDDLVL